MNETKQMFQTTKQERIAYPMFSFGQNIVYGLIMAYLSLYYTDHLLIPAVTVSLIFLCAKIWDAINDPLFGIIVDRSSFKGGKFRPWLRISTVLIPILTVLMFNIPGNLSLGMRTGLAAATYVLWSMAYTVSDVPVFSLVTAMTGNVQERSTLVSYGSIASVICAIILGVFLVPQLETVGFGPIGILVAALSFIFMLPLTLKAKERNRAAVDAKEKSSLKEMAAYIKGNRYLLLFNSFYILNGCFAVGTTLSSYILIYCLGSLKYQAIFTAAGVLPLLLIYLLMPKLTARFERMSLYKFCIIAQMLLSFITYFAGYGNIAVYGTLVILKTLFGAPAAMLSFTFTMDCVEYGHFKTGIRKEGITFSIQTFANKLNGAISGTLALFILGLIGYDGALLAQSSYTLQMMWSVNCLIPAAATLLTLPLLFRYRLKCSDVQIMANINAGKISREEGCAALSRQYDKD